MTSRPMHVVFLYSSVSTVFVLLLVTVSVCKAPTASPRYPKQHLLRSTTHQRLQQQRQGGGQGSSRIVKLAEGQDKNPIAAAAGTEAWVKAEAETEAETKRILAAMISKSKAWPQLMGLRGEEARKKLLADHPHLAVQNVPEDSYVTMNYKMPGAHLGR